jgi:hypothetical protein
MALVVADRVKETSTTQGTGAFTLAGASTGFQSFAVIGNGNQTYYTIAEQGGSNWEVGIGTYNSSGTTLTRNVVLSSTNAGSLVAFGPGAKDVFVTYPAERAVYGDTASVIQYSAIDADSIDVNSLLTVTGTVSVTGSITTDTITATDVLNIANNLTVQTLTAADSTSNVTLIYGEAYSVSGANAVPMIDMSGVWNTTGEPTLVKYNVTNTASGTNSLLLDLQVGGSSRFRVDKDGDVFAASSIFGAAVSVSSGFTGTTGTFTTGTITNLTATNETVTSLTATAETVTSLTVTNETVSTITGATNSFCDMDTIQGDVIIATSTPANTQIFFSDSGSISGSSAVALFDIAATWNTTGSPTGFKLNVADSASDTLSSFIDLQRNGSSQFKINKYGGANTRAILQTATITAAAPSATTDYDVITQVVQYYTTDATANFTLNFRGNSSISLASYMSIGQSVEVVLLVTNGATPYYPNAFQIDGSAVTPKWITGVAPTAGNANSVDVYTFTIVETAAATFTVFATQNKFA